ncbi:MAG: hypothetical protein MJA29_02505 [Candidatus Omnitrophica bacterium]|nr:hypothetical protein [Candidatus Omnitrophota bacterium]
MRKKTITLMLGLGMLFLRTLSLPAEESAPGTDKDTSIVVNGDEVEYQTDRQKVTARGNVEVFYKGALLTADSLSVDTAAKSADAVGDVRLRDPRGTIMASRGSYNFNTGHGEFFDASFWADPYFGRASRVEKAGDKEITAYDCYLSTSSYDNPEYRIHAQKVTLIPGEKLRTRRTSFKVGRITLLKLPLYNHSLKDPFMHVRLVPGKKKDWGAYMLSAWRYNLADNLNGRIYTDYRSKLGMAYGFGLNYQTGAYGSGDYKLYYTNESPDDLPDGVPHDYERFLMRWRHIWHIDDKTDAIAEMYEIGDERRKFQDPLRNFLKDYFPREFDEDSEPLSYIQVHRNFQYSTMDILFQKRTNQWFDQIEKLPEVRYTLPGVQIADTPFYFDSSSSLVQLDKKAETSPVSADDIDMFRLDTLNKFSLPSRVSIIKITPFVGSRQTVYDKGADGKDLPVRTQFLSGADLSTKFFRVFDAKTSAFGLDINRLRHIITPSIAYTYSHAPTVPSYNIKQVDGVDGASHSNQAVLMLSNKLQTKREGNSVDLADFRVSSSYLFKPKTSAKRGSNLSDFLFELDLLPYSWMSCYIDATLNHSGSRHASGYKKFSTVSYDLTFNFGEDRSAGLGQRYQRGGGNEITSSFLWRFNPKWKIRMYNRYEIGRDPLLKRGWKEQEYTISRDLHSWELELTYNVKRLEGETIWLLLRLKAFPELEFGLDQSYHQPKSGAGQ